jgi:colicin import membrane protein
MRLTDAKNIVSYESVSMAAEQIRKSGTQPSIRKIIDFLGGGSPNQVTSLMRRWRGEQAVDVPRCVIIDSRISDILSLQILEAVAQARVDADAARDTAVSDSHLLAEKGLALEERVAADAERLFQLETEHLQDTGVIGALREELRQLKIETASSLQIIKSEAADTVLAATQQMQVDREKAAQLYSQFGTLTGQLDHFVKNTAELKLEVVRLTQVLANSEAARYAAVEGAAVAAARLESMQLRTDRAESSLDKLTDEQSSAVQKVHQSELQIQSLQLKNQSLANEVDVARLALIQANEHLKPAKPKRSGSEIVLAKAINSHVDDLFDAREN